VDASKIVVIGLVSKFNSNGFRLSVSLIILLGIAGWNKIEPIKRKAKLILIVSRETAVSVTE
jgi:hypothetical protein